MKRLIIIATLCLSSTICLSQNEGFGAGGFGKGFSYGQDTGFNSGYVRIVSESQAESSWTDIYFDDLLALFNMEGTNAAGESVGVSTNLLTLIPKPNFPTGPTVIHIAGTNQNGRIEHDTFYDGINGYHYTTNLQGWAGNTSGIISIWVKWIDTNSSGYVFSICRNADSSFTDISMRYSKPNDNFRLEYSYQNSVRWRITNASFSVAQQVGEFHHHVWRMDSSQSGTNTLSYFLDGIQQAIGYQNQADPGHWFDNLFAGSKPADIFSVGAYLYNNFTVFQPTDQYLDDIRIYGHDRVLTSNEVYTLYENTKMPNENVEER